MRIKILAFTASMIMVIGLLAGCGNGVSSASTMVAANKTAQDKVESVRVDCDLDMDMTMNMKGMEKLIGSSELSMPIKMKMRLDSGKETAHTTANVSMSLFGKNEESEAEMYIDSKNGVTYTGKNGSWKKSTSEADLRDMMSGLNSLDESVINESEFMETDDAYTVTLNATQLGDVIKDMNLLDELNDNAFSFDDFSVSDGKVVYAFDKSTKLLKSIKMDNLKVDAKGNVQGAPYGIVINMNGTFNFSKYNKLAEKDYAIPQEVIDSAK